MKQATDPEASAYVDASAGSGKTKLLVDRIVRMLIYGVKPSKILCITFTSAAAEEMYERLQHKLLLFLTIDEDKLKHSLFDLNGYIPTNQMIQRARSLFGHFISDRPKIQTLHGFCSKILQKMHVINLQDNIRSDSTKILDDNEKTDLLYESFNEIISNFDNQIINNSLKTLLKKYEASYLFTLICEFWNGIASSNSNQFFDLFAEKYLLESDILEMLKQKLYDFFQTDVSKSEQAIIDDHIKKLDKVLLNEAFEVLKQSENITSKKASEIIQRFLEKQNRETFFEYVGILLTGDFKPRARLPLNADAAKEFVHIKDFLLNEQKMLQDTIELIHQVSAAEINAAFSVLSWSVLKNFNEKKQHLNLFEYSDLIRHTTNLMQHSEDKMTLLYSIDVMIDHIMIDEAQDLSEMQWLLIQTITDEFFAGLGTTANKRTIFIVGDFKQAIFGFQGAAPKIFQDVKGFYREKVIGIGKKWHEIQLDTCFRCTPEILNLVDRVCNTDYAKDAFNVVNSSILHKSIHNFGHGKIEIHQIDSELETKNNNKDISWHLPTSQQKVDVEKDEQWLIANKIAETIHLWLTNDKKIGPNKISILPQDILILLRKRSKLQDHLVDALQKFNIPITNLAAKEFRNSIHIYNLLATAQFALQPLDDMNLVALLKSHPFRLYDESIMEICIGRETSVWERINSDESYKVLSEILINSQKMDVQSFFQWYLDVVYKISNSETTRFMGYVLSYCGNVNPLSISLKGFVVWIHEILSQKQQRVYDNKSVRITTVHSAKGLEAPVVILADASSSESMSTIKFAYEGDMFILNIKNSSKAAKEMFLRYNDKSAKENMRLLYVAMTRPKYELHAFGSNNEKNSWYTMIKDSLSFDSIDAE